MTIPLLPPWPSWRFDPCKQSEATAPAAASLAFSPLNVYSKHRERDLRARWKPAFAGWYLLTVCEEQRQMCGWTEIKADLQARGGLGEEEVVILWASEERNRWKRKRIMLHNQAVYFPAWNGEHKKRCRDAFIVGASFGWLCHCLLPKTKMLKMHKKLAFLTNFPQNYWI